MLVKDVMSREIVTVTPEETLIDLTTKLLKYNFHTLPVIDEGRNVCGIVNFKDIMKIFSSHNPALEKLLKASHLYNVEEEDILEAEIPENLGTKITIADIMNTNVVTVDEDKTIADARNCMKLHNIERMPVVRGRQLAGFITIFDIIIAILRKRNIIK